MIQLLLYVLQVMKFFSYIKKSFQVQVKLRYLMLFQQHVQ